MLSQELDAEHEDSSQTQLASRPQTVMGADIFSTELMTKITKKLIISNAI